MEFKLRFTEKEITAWGGMGLMKQMLDRIGFSNAAESCELPEPGSNRGYAPSQLILQFMLSIWCGANRFEHAEVTRHDPVLKKLFNFNVWQISRRLYGCLGNLIKRPQHGYLEVYTAGFSTIFRLII